MLATLLAVILLLWYLLFVDLAFRQKGTLSAYYGSAGVMAMLLSVVVLVIAAGSLKEEDSFPFFPRAGMALSILAMVCWIGTYAIGFL
jgi:hypothetical protein